MAREVIIAVSVVNNLSPVFNIQAGTCSPKRECWCNGVELYKRSVLYPASPPHSVSVAFPIKIICPSGILTKLKPVQI